MAQHALNFNIEFPLPDGRDLVQGPLTYNSDGLATLHNCDFINDPLFAAAYQHGMNTGHHFEEDIHIEWRVHVACWAANQVRYLEGDYVECGVNTGILSRAIMHFIKFEAMPNKKFYLLDTYQGIPLKNALSGCAQKENEFYYDCYERVKQNFKDYQNAVIIKGEVPGTLGQVPSQKVCYLAIDMNTVEPEIATIKYFWNKLVTGAVVVLDDYGWIDHRDQKAAFDQFGKEKGFRVLSLPTGQGLIVKA